MGNCKSLREESNNTWNPEDETSKNHQVNKHNMINLGRGNITYNKDEDIKNQTSNMRSRCHQRVEDNTSFKKNFENHNGKEGRILIDNMQKMIRFREEANTKT